MNKAVILCTLVVASISNCLSQEQNPADTLTFTLQSGHNQELLNGRVTMTYQSREGFQMESKLSFTGIEGVADEPEGPFRNHDVSISAGQTFYFKVGSDTLYRVHVAREHLKVVVLELFGTRMQTDHQAVRQDSVGAAVLSAEAKQTLYLRDGVVVQGKIVAENDSMVVLDTRYGTLTIQRTMLARSDMKPPAGEHAYRSYSSSKRNRWISGLVSLSLVSNERTSVTTIELAPSAVFFLGTGFGLGLDMSGTWVMSDGETATQLALGPKMVVAFGKWESPARPYIGFGVDYLSVGGTAVNESTNGSIVKTAFGIMTRIGENLGLPVELGMIFTTIGSQKTTTYALGIGLAGLLN